MGVQTSEISDVLWPRACLPADRVYVYMHIERGVFVWPGGEPKLERSDVAEEVVPCAFIESRRSL
jgi:hypothetical protein